MSPKLEPVRTGAYLISEANGTRSRVAIDLLTGNGVVVAGTVLGKVTASGKYVPHAAGAADGSENAAGILYASKDTTDADQNAVMHAIDCEVDDKFLTWETGISQGNKDTAVAALESVGAFIRDLQSA